MGPIWVPQCDFIWNRNEPNVVHIEAMWIHIGPSFSTTKLFLKNLLDIGSILWDFIGSTFRMPTFIMAFGFGVGHFECLLLHWHIAASGMIL